MVEESELALYNYAAFPQRSIWWPNVGGVTEVSM